MAPQVPGILLSLDARALLVLRRLQPPVLPLLSSHDRLERQLLPVQLVPMFWLMNTISDVDMEAKGDTWASLNGVVHTQLQLGFKLNSKSKIKDLFVSKTHLFPTLVI